MPDISKAIEAMDRACRVWSVGYDQSNRWDIRDGGETDCSALVIWALRQGGFDTGSATYTGNLSANLCARGWQRLPADLSAARPGDLLLNDTHHVCMVIGGSGTSATVAQASIDERGRATGGASGDQTGRETNERRIYTYRHGWDCILRYVGGGATQPASAPALDVDGWWGSATTRRLQEVLGTPQDGVVSSQWSGRRGILAACTSGWEWVTSPHGSTCIRALQSRLGVAADGIMGPLL